jgi:DNA-binding NtrC family response regulator
MNASRGTRPLRLLIIDDERGFVSTLAKRLAKRNIQASQAYSGREGIQVLRKSDFDVVLLDLKMEDIDGMEVLKIIKIMVPDLPVIMLSGHASDETARIGKQAGAFEYLTKPYELDELIEKIHLAVGDEEDH